jgi:hypothetical protein
MNRSNTGLGLRRPVEGGLGCTIGRLERLPKWLNLVPIIAQWLWLSLRYRSITLPSSANPAITTGGMVGEGKMEDLQIMGARALSVTATTTSITAEGEASIRAAEDAMTHQGLVYPVILKPDIGWCGYGVRRVDNFAQLSKYLNTFPRGERVVIQRFVDEPGEAGIFYMRQPGHESGKVIGMLLRHFPQVMGDGIRTVGALIDGNERTRRIGRDGASESGSDLTAIPALGETVRVATVGSTRVGGMYQNGTASVTTELVAAIDAIARDMKDFHVGRFDVKFQTMASLRSGAFTIIEVNGSGSEAVHAWDPTLTLRQAYRIIFDKQRLLFAIGDDMRKRGHSPVGLTALARHHLRQQKLISQYPPSN